MSKQNSRTWEDKEVLIYLIEISPIEMTDDALTVWIEREEVLFRTLEKFLIAERLRSGFNDDVEGFIKYSYIDLNELIREDIQGVNTIVYSYDSGGNITNKTYYSYTTGTLANPTSTISYTYDNSWKDKLINYNGKTLTYDAIGNLATYDGYAYTWDEGRNLKGITGNGKNISYSYDDKGVRLFKTVNGVTTSYQVVDGRVTQESNPTDKIYYTYGVNDEIVSMNLNGTEYYYVKNIQKDIIGLIDNTGTQVVSYEYDAWGKILSITGSLADTVGQKNPYRYRGYRYDNETGLYYLQSRYYNPEWSRFINADDSEILLKEQNSILQHNLFAYCLNNPVNSVDYDGYYSNSAAIADFALKYGVGLSGFALTLKMTSFIAAVAPYLLGAVAVLVAGYLVYKIVKNAKTKKPSDILKKLPTKILKGSKVDISKFNKKRGGKDPRWVGPAGWYLERDNVGHSDRYWKLFDWAGERIASLTKDGKILSK